MSQKIRGQEVTMRIAVDGVVQGGSLIKITDVSQTARTDLNEDDYLGEDETDLDIQHHGWDGSFGIDYQDASAIDLVEQILDNEANNIQHPKITITFIYNFRESGARGRVITYRNVFLKMSEESVGGRKEKVKGKFDFKAKRRSVANA